MFDLHRHIHISLTTEEPLTSLPGKSSIKKNTKHTSGQWHISMNFTPRQCSCSFFAHLKRNLDDFLAIQPDVVNGNIGSGTLLVFANSALLAAPITVTFRQCVHKADLIDLLPIYLAKHLQVYKSRPPKNVPLRPFHSPA